MVDILLIGIIFALVGLLAYQAYLAKAERDKITDAHQIERNKYINALVAKSDEALRDLTMADKVAQIKPMQEAPSPPDLIPMNQLSEEDFDEAIAHQLANG